MEIAEISFDSQFEKLFKESFDKFFEGLHRYAYTLLKDNDKANDAVQAVFAKWWELKTNVNQVEAAKAYLYTSVYRHCLNVIRHDKVKIVNNGIYAREMKAHSNDVEESSNYAELDQRVVSAIESLPPQCGLIFSKSRVEGKRYAEIATEMQLSIKTIEAQMGKALKILREQLHEYL